MVRKSCGVKMKRLRFLFSVFIAVSLMPFLCMGDEPVIAPLPEGEAVCDDYEMTVDGKPVPVCACRVSLYPLNQTWPGYQRPMDQTEITGFACWEMADDASVHVDIVSKREVESVIIRPQSLGIVPKVEGNRISFDLPKRAYTVVETNDSYHGALHLLPSRKYQPPADKNAEGLHYFGPGVHDLGVLNLKDNESVYLDAGAFVYGSIHGKGISNVRVEGPGVIDASRFERGKGGGCLRFEQCKNVLIDGPVLRDPDVWTVNVFNCSDIVVRNLRIIGLWRYNADGIDVCNSHDVLVENCFLRTFDDSLVLKGLPAWHEDPNYNVTFRGCTVWCDWGRALEVGAETCAPEVWDIVYEDCDVIRTTGIAMDIQHYDEANVHDIRFENIRAEFDAWIPREIIQKEENEQYVPDKNSDYCSKLMCIVMPEWRAPWSSEKHGITRNIVFKDITVYSDRMPPSSFTGYTDEHDVDGVVVQNVRIYGESPRTDNESLNLSVNGYVKNLTISQDQDHR